jgi:hypothetical protein
LKRSRANVIAISEEEIKVIELKLKVTRQSAMNNK